MTSPAQLDSPVLDDSWIAEESESSRPSGGLRDRLARRRLPLVLSVVLLATGLSYMFFWLQLWDGIHAWAIGGDVWGIFRGAHYVGWGLPAGVYSPDNGIIAFPGLEVLLAPLAMFSSHFHLTESFGPFQLAHPSAALLLMPTVMLLGSSTLFAVDAAAEHFALPRPRRVGLLLASLIVLWPMLVVWGHPEDALAITFGLYSLLAMFEGRWMRAGWLMGFAIAFQPLVALVVPLYMATTPQGQRVLFAIRSAALSALLVGICLLGNAAETLRAIVEQPATPLANHATPWAALSPAIAAPSTPAAHVAELVNKRLGRVAIKTFTESTHVSGYLAGGPGRTIDVLFAVLVGLYVWRRPQSAKRLVWLAAVVLASRCFFESVMTAYYTAPMLVVLLIAASFQSRKRFLAVCALAGEVTIFGYHHLSPWAWWTPIVVSMAAIIVLSLPPKESSPPAAETDTDVSGVSADDEVTLPGALRRRTRTLVAT